MCYEHHIETDDVEEYPVEKLKEIKRIHEEKFETFEFTIDDALIKEIRGKMERYWISLDLASASHELPDLKFEIDSSSSALELFSQLDENIQFAESIFNRLYDSGNKLEGDLEEFLKNNGIDKSFLDSVHYKDNPFLLRDIELLTIGCPNIIKKLNIVALHLKVKYLELELSQKIDVSDRLHLQEELDLAKNSLIDFAKNEIYVD